MSPTRISLIYSLLTLVLTELFQYFISAQILDDENQEESQLIRVLEIIKQEHNFVTLYIDSCSSGNGSMMKERPDVLFKKLSPIPLVIMAQNEEKFEWKMHFTKEILVMKCISLSSEQTLFEQLTVLAFTLQHMRQTRILLFLEIDEENDVKQKHIEEIFTLCEQLQMSKVVALLSDFQSSENLYFYLKYPQFSLWQQNLESATKIFINPVGNLHGHPIFTLPDQLKPRTIVFEDANGEQIFSGYIGKLMHTFAQKLNTTVKFPFRIQLGINSFMGELENFTRAGVIEISSAIDSPRKNLNPYEFSLPVEFAQMMPMLPVEPQLQVHELFLLMFQSRLFQLIFGLSMALSLVLTVCTALTEVRNVRFWEIILNEKALRGILGQSFPLNERSASRIKIFIFCLIFIAGLLVTTSYGAFLQSLLTEPPTQPRINTFDDLLKSSLKIMMSQQELPIMELYHGERWLRKYLPSFEVLPSFTEYLTRRSSFNNTYGYTVSSSIWPLIEQIQSGFQRRMFRLSPEMYFQEDIVFCLPVRENSIFMETLNDYIMHVHDAGLMMHWRTATFIDMVANKMIVLRDLSVARVTKALVLHDFQVVWTIYVVATGFSIIVFIVEIFFNMAFKRMRKSVNY